MVILAEKLVHFLKSPFRLDDSPADASSASLHDFRTKTSGFLSQAGGNGSEMKSFAWFNNCFEMMHVANNAFGKLVVEIDYPMSQWGAAATHDYLSYTLSLMDMLNSINSSVSHLNMLKISVLHGLSLVENSPNSAAKHLNKIWSNNLCRGFKVERPPPGIHIRPGSDHKEHVILEALMVLKKIGFFALGLVVSGLCSDAKPFLEMRSDDPLKKVMELRFCRDVTKIQSFVEEVNCAAERLSAAISSGECDEAVGELKGRLEVMENAIQGIEKQANSLFYEVLATRNKLLDNIQFAGYMKM
ncbi:hypothetical protein C2S52_016856 [Perilla frutescens var. hirtella]|nr:hypothetical protein C2S52_016856 [Perilla frutescens var. hirtella]